MVLQTPLERLGVGTRVRHIIARDEHEQVCRTPHPPRRLDEARVLLPPALDEASTPPSTTRQTEIRQRAISVAEARVGNDSIGLTKKMLSHTCR